MRARTSARPGPSGCGVALVTVSLLRIGECKLLNTTLTFRNRIVQCITSQRDRTRTTGHSRLRCCASVGLSPIRHATSGEGTGREFQLLRQCRHSCRVAVAPGPRHTPRGGYFLCGRLLHALAALHYLLTHYCLPIINVDTIINVV